MLKISGKVSKFDSTMCESFILKINFILKNRKRMWPKGHLADSELERSKDVKEITKMLARTTLLCYVSGIFLANNNQVLVVVVFLTMKIKF